MTSSQHERTAALRLIVCLGVVSLFADMTYEGARGIVGPYLQNLGATAAEVGFIAGFGEMVAAGLRYFFGKVADRTRAYWTITICGYFVNLIAVPALAFAGNWPMAALCVILERTGKGLRGPARDVLLSEATGKVGHGWGFGLHTAMDQTGAVLGPLFVFLAVARSQQYKPAFLWLAVPAAATVIALFAARFLYPQAGNAAPAPVAQQKLPKVFWTYVAAAGLLACGFIDFPLLAYHFQKTQLVRPAIIPLLYAGAMGINGAVAPLFGKLFDRYGVRTLALGILVSLFALPLGFLGGPAAAMAGVACWATGMGLQDATLRPAIAEVVSMNKRGAAFGAFNGIYGISWFAGSAIMGLLYTRSLVALVVFGVAVEIAAAAVFYGISGKLRK